MKIKTYIILIIILIIISLLILIKNYNENIIGGEIEEKLILEKNNLKECCTYINEHGEEKICSVMKKYSCDLCTRCS